MNYSTALLESIEAGPNISRPLSGHTLDTWHLPTAMANNPYSVGFCTERLSHADR